MSQPLSTPFFSIVMPVYNHEAYLNVSIESVLAQTFGDWELLAIDDGSTDNSGRMLDEWAAKDRRIVVIHQPNGGEPVARNRALAAARGEWLAFLDSDDLWYPQTLQNYADYIAAHPEATFIHGYRHRLGRDGAVEKPPGEFQDRETGAAELFGRMYLSCLCVCFRRKLAALVGGYDPALRTSTDYDFYLRLSRHTRFQPLGKATGLRRRHETNISSCTGRTRMVEAGVLERFVNEFGGRGILPPDLIARRLSRVYFTAGRAYLREGQYQQAVEALQRAARYRPGLRIAGLMFAARMWRRMKREAG
jgi:tetratricopeptide (TPR) repeat protein